KVMGVIFKLLSGVGSVYQPTCLNWLMAGAPDQEDFGLILQPDVVMYFEKFCRQIYERHLEYLRTNKVQMNYFTTLLNVVVESGSTTAFRIRDEIL
ncbi:MAG TPA: hypothetical protein VG737_16970, partial [Cyclobacteriaceae bacterium]|nr:hypothetical protein [Cyclobacteriaceae bacterium]